LGELFSIFDENRSQEIAFFFKDFPIWKTKVGSGDKDLNLGVLLSRSGFNKKIWGKSQYCPVII
jgi:hypothetical protein